MAAGWGKVTCRCGRFVGVRRAYHAPYCRRLPARKGNRRGAPTAIMSPAGPAGRRAGPAPRVAPWSA